VTQHLPPADRTRDLLAVAVAVAAVQGWRTLTRDAIAAAAGVSPGLVSARLGTMDALRRSVMRAAVRERVVPVVAEGLVHGDKQARRADEALVAQAAAWVAR
jgi:AcrR family transcriptional regulator